MCVVNLEGNYLVNGNKLKRSDLVLLQRNRKKQTDKKPTKFLLINLGAGFEYVSSLYQVGQNSYVFDTLNNSKYDLVKSRYRLELNNNTAVIKRR